MFCCDFHPVTWAFCNRKLVPLRLFHPFFSSLYPFPSETTSSWFLWVCFFLFVGWCGVFVYLFFVFFYTSHLSEIICSLTYFISIIPYRSIQVVANGKSSFFSRLSNSPLHIYINNAVINIVVCISFQISVFILFG